MPPTSPIPIESLEDPCIADYADVRDVELRGNRFAKRLFMVESEMVIRRALTSSFRLKSIFLSPERLESLAPALAEAAGDVPVYVAETELLRAVTGYPHHHGALAVGIRPEPSRVTVDHLMDHLSEHTRCLLLLIQGVTNVDNMGTFFRNAAAFGVDGLILDETCCDPLFRRAIRISMGHVFSVPWAVSEHWKSDLSRLRDDHGLRLFGAEVTEEALPLPEITRPDRLGVLLGSEGHGLSPESLALCENVYQIPMATGVPSLNVAVASAVVLYELNRTARPDESGLPG